MLTLGLLAALVVCGKSGHHPALKGPSGLAPRVPAAWSPPTPPLHQAQLPPQLWRGLTALEGVDRQDPFLGSGWIPPSSAQPHGLAGFHGSPLPGPPSQHRIPLPVPPQAAGA